MDRTDSLLLIVPTFFSYEVDLLDHGGIFTHIGGELGKDVGVFKW